MQLLKICVALAALSCAVGCNKANTVPPDDPASTWQSNPQSKAYVSQMKAYYKSAPSQQKTDSGPDYAEMERRAHGGH